MPHIAWLPNERLGAYVLMEDAGFTGLEIAPGLFFSAASDPFVPDDATARVALAEIDARGLSLVSMQSLLFGVQGASLFGNKSQRIAFDAGMTRAIDLAGRFGIPNLVFGSPSQRRIPEGLPVNDAHAYAIETFCRLGDHAIAAGTVISMEPNPVAYGTNFLNTMDQVVEFVIRVGHPGILRMLDLGAMKMNQNTGLTSVQVGDLAMRLNHVHVSEPNLAPAPADAAFLIPVLKQLRAAGYNKAVSIEMKRHAEGLPALQDCIAALRAASVGASGC